MRNFFILCIMNSHPGEKEFFLFHSWLAFVLKYEQKTFSKKITKIFQVGFFSLISERYKKHFW